MCAGGRGAQRCVSQTEPQRGSSAPHQSQRLLLHCSGVSRRDFCVRFFLDSLHLRQRAGVPKNVRRDHSHLAESCNAHSDHAAAAAADVPSESQISQSHKRDLQSGFICCPVSVMGVVGAPCVRDLGVSYHGSLESRGIVCFLRRRVAQHGSSLPVRREAQPHDVEQHRESEEEKEVDVYWNPH